MEDILLCHYICYIATCQIYIFKKTDLTRFVKINLDTQMDSKKQIWVEKKQKWEPCARYILRFEPV